MSNYSEYRKNIKSGDFIAYRSRYRSGWTSWLGFMVSLFSLSRYSHVGVAIELGERLFLVSADIPEVKLELLSKTKPFYHVPMNIEWSSQNTENLLKHLGERYSILEAIKGYFRKNNDENDLWFCTEFAKDFYKTLDIPFSKDMTPQDMVDDIINLGGKTVTFVDTKR